MCEAANMFFKIISNWSKIRKKCCGIKKSSLQVLALQNKYGKNKCSACLLVGGTSYYWVVAKAYHTSECT